MEASLDGSSTALWLKAQISAISNRAMIGEDRDLAFQNALGHFGQTILFGIRGKAGTDFLPNVAGQGRNNRFLENLRTCETIGINKKIVRLSFDMTKYDIGTIAENRPKDFFIYGNNRAYLGVGIFHVSPSPALVISFIMLVEESIMRCVQ